MPILVHFKAKNNDNSYFYKNSGLSFPWVPYYVKTNIFLTRMKDPLLIDVSSPSTKTPRYEKQINQRQGLLKVYLNISNQA